jgi:hypothetical protein
MQAIKMVKRYVVDKLTALSVFELVFIVGDDDGGAVLVNGNFYRACTQGFADARLRDGSAIKFYLPENSQPARAISASVMR